MHLKKKDILFYITYTVILIFLLFHFQDLFLLFKKFISLLMPFWIGIIIAFIANVLLTIVENKWLKKWKSKKKRGVSIFLTFFLFLVFLSFLFVLILPQLGETVQIFTDNLPTYIETVEDKLDSFGISKKDIEKITTSLDDFKSEVVDYAKDNKNELFEFGMGLATNFIGAFTNVVFGFVFSIYLLFQKEKLKKQGSLLLKAYFPIKVQTFLVHLLTVTKQTFTNFISGQCTEAFLIGFLCFLGMLILQIPYAPSISVLIGVTSLIPVFGAFFGTFIGAFLILMVSPMKTIIFVVFILILQQIEGNFIYPKVVGKSVGLPSLWVMIAVTIGASLYGIIGILLSVPLSSICYTLFREFTLNRLEHKKKK